MRTILLMCSVVAIAGSATTTIPYRGGRQPVEPSRAPAPRASEMPARLVAEPLVKSVDLDTSASPRIGLRADISEGRHPIAVLRRGDVEVARIPLTKYGVGTWDGAFDLAPGDYQLSVSDGASKGETIQLMARMLSCVRGQKRLVVHERTSGTLVRVGAEPSLVVPRWYREDQDFSFVVEWLRDGKLAYELTGTTDHLEQNLTALEGMYNSTQFEQTCSHDFGERYTAPDLEAGSWEVRVHRTGAASVVARFEVTGGEREIDLPFVAMTSPGAGAARVARLRSCPARSLMRKIATGETSGYAAYCEGGMAHSGTGAAVAATAAELRALMRDPEVFEIRKRMDAMLDGEGPLDRPDFEYDSERSPDDNWHRKRAWEKRDTERQFSNERTLASRARAKHRAALLARVKRFGGPWTAEETPAPVRK